MGKVSALFREDKVLICLQAVVEEPGRGDDLLLTQTQTGLDILRWCSPLVLRPSLDGEWSFRVFESCDGADGPGDGTCVGF